MCPRRFSNRGARRRNNVARLIEPDGTPNIIVTVDYAIRYCRHNPGWTWEYVI